MFKLTIDDDLILTLESSVPGDRTESETILTKNVVAALEGFYGIGYEKDSQQEEYMYLVSFLKAANEIIDDMSIKQIMAEVAYLLTDEEDKG